MIIIIMIACCYVGALGPKAELILVCAAKLGIGAASPREPILELQTVYCLTVYWSGSEVGRLQARGFFAKRPGFEPRPRGYSYVCLAPSSPPPIRE